MPEAQKQQGKDSEAHHCIEAPPHSAPALTSGARTTAWPVAAPPTSTVYRPCSTGSVPYLVDWTANHLNEKVSMC